MISNEERAKLTEIGLSVLSSTKNTEHNISEHHGSPSLTNPDESSSMYYNVEGTAEEYNEMNKKKKKKIT